MFNFVKRPFIGLLSFSNNLARDRTKFTSLNDEPCMIKPTLIDLNLVELKYYLFKIILDKSTGSCCVLSPKIFVPKEIIDINVKAFNAIK